MHCSYPDRTMGLCSKTQIMLSFNVPDEYQQEGRILVMSLLWTPIGSLSVHRYNHSAENHSHFLYIDVIPISEVTIRMVLLTLESLKE